MTNERQVHYRLSDSCLSIDMDLPESWCQHKSDDALIRHMLMQTRQVNLLEVYSMGRLNLKLERVGIR